MDTVALTVNKRTHFRVPTTNLVTKVDARIKEVAHLNFNRHRKTPAWLFGLTPCNTQAFWPTKLWYYRERSKSGTELKQFFANEVKDN
ncbi:hypothetical protein [Silvanigrella sp.]|uniref:hypothetical protein n=1 Tax=Silvanigrella sp. TaxID=2024976 RepID=UPI0037CC947D